MALGILLLPFHSAACPTGFRSRAAARRHFGVIPLCRISLSKPNLTFVLRWVFRLEREERIHTIHGILHNRLHFIIGDSGKPGRPAHVGHGCPAWTCSIGPFRNASATIAFASLTIWCRVKSPSMSDDFGTEPSARCAYELNRGRTPVNWHHVVSPGIRGTWLWRETAVRLEFSKRLFAWAMGHVAQHYDALSRTAKRP